MGYRKTNRVLKSGQGV